MFNNIKLQRVSARVRVRVWVRVRVRVRARVRVSVYCQNWFVRQAGRSVRAGTGLD